MTVFPEYHVSKDRIADIICNTILHTDNKISNKLLNDKNVINITKTAPNIPNVWDEVNPNNDQVEVLSSPNIKFESGIQIDDETLTIQTIYDANHINVPINANFLPTDLCIQT